MNTVIKNTQILIVIVLFIFSCSEDFLQRNPTNQLSVETFYKSKDDFDMALAACYATLQDQIFASASLNLDCLTDNAGEGKFNAPSIAQGPITPYSGGYVDEIFTGSYQKIARYNIFLDNLSSFNKSVSGGDWIKTYEAEVRLMRAMKYFDLYRFYGSVPLIVEPLTYANNNQPKATENRIKEQIIADLDFAVSTLPDKSFANNGGKFVKSSALALKSRVLLFDGYDENGSAKADVMLQVKNITSDIISKNYYTIAPSFRGLFCDDLKQQEGNPEMLFSIKFKAPENYVQSFNGWGLSAVYLFTTTPGGNIIPYKNFANEFEFIDGTPFSESNPLYDKTNIYKNRDPRMAKTIFSGTVVFEDGFTFSIPTPSPTGYSYYKTFTSTDTKPGSFDRNGSYWPAMRYAEVLLMYAEAANEVDGPVKGVYDAINMIRARTDVKMPPVTAGLSKDQMRNVIRHERRVELAFEGFRYDDCKRWKIAEKIFTMPRSETLILPKNFNKINYHFPIPQSEIDKSKGILIQNPDYK